MVRKEFCSLTVYVVLRRDWARTGRLRQRGKIRVDVFGRGKKGVRHVNGPGAEGLEFYMVAYHRCLTVTRLFYKYLIWSL